MANNKWLFWRHFNQLLKTKYFEYSILYDTRRHTVLAANNEGITGAACVVYFLF